MIGTMNIKVDISPGELVDKLTILEIKLQHISEADKLKNIQYEYGVLLQTFQRCIAPTEELNRLMLQLKTVNEALWDIEDEIRDCEREKNFSTKFIELARSVYTNNDQRSRIKREINLVLESPIIEEKSYSKYD